MPNVIKPTQARGEATLVRILRATERLLADKPFDRLSIAEISEAAEMSVGNFYNRLPNKESLLFALYLTYEDERTESLLAELESKRWDRYGLDECVKAIVGHVVDFFLDRRHLIRSYVLHFRMHPDTATDKTRARLRLLADRFAAHLHAAAKRDDTTISEYDAKIAHQIILALCREFILFSDDPSKQPLELDRDSVVRTVSDAANGYLARR